MLQKIIKFIARKCAEKELIMANMNNFGVLRGRLTANVKTFANKDGSSKVKFTIACEDNYKGKDGKRGAQMIPVETYVKSDFDKSPYSRIHKGDKVSLEYDLRMNNYKDKNGADVYDTIVFVNGIQFEESKSVTEARAAENAAKAAAAATPAEDSAIAAAPVPEMA